MANYYNPKIGARGGNACHGRRPYSKYEIERLLSWHRQHEEAVIFTQAGKPVTLSRRRLRIDGKLVTVPKDKQSRSIFVRLLKSGMDWYRAIDAVGLLASGASITEVVTFTTTSKDGRLVPDKY